MGVIAGSRSILAQSAVVAAVVFAAALLGILSRLPGAWAVFWPANALLLGLMIRWRALPVYVALPAAFVGYVAADMITRTHLPASVLLACCNLAGVTAAYLLIRSLPVASRGLGTAASAAWVATAAVLGAVTGAIGGGFASILVFDGTWTSGWAGWFVVEFVNYMVLLPVVLSFPARAVVDIARRNRAGRVQLASARRMLRRSLVPAALLAALLSVAGLAQGGGAIAFTVPALIAAALATNVFVTTLFVLISTVGMLALAVGQGAGPPPAPVSLSTDVGLALLAIGPLVVAAAMAERNRVAKALREAFITDDLTGALRRGEFLARAEKALSTMASQNQASALLMMDLDHFKRLNDTRGHQAGDRALTDFSTIVAATLRDGDLFGRLGGEEFAVLMRDADLALAVSTARHICSAQRAQAQSAFGDDGATVSIGVSCAAKSDGLSPLLARADAAVYRAKENDRDQVVVDGFHMDAAG